VVALENSSHHGNRYGAKLVWAQASALPSRLREVIVERTALTNDNKANEGRRTPLPEVPVRASTIDLRVRVHGTIVLVVLNVARANVIALFYVSF